ncbi:MAG: putative OPT family oligopeptide transporter [Bradymonadia bacterium]|jgi:putative OPT family oligopeptide transporter
MAMGQKSGAESPRELTLRVVVLGIVLAVVMGAANVYLGLKAGLTVSASIPAAVMAMLILRGLFKDGTILEANQVQTAASAGESLAAGIIFTMPAIVIIGVWNEFDMLTTTAVAFAGGLLGILFMIPMRKVFVVDDEELKFPEGVACAAVLEAGDADSEDAGRQARSVIWGALMGLGFTFALKFLGVFKGVLAWAGGIGNRIAYFGGDVSPALVAVGFIVKLEIAVLIFIGGALGWLVGIPLIEASADQLANPHDGAFAIWSTQIRYVGVGAMVMGGMAAIWRVRGGLVKAVTELNRKRKSVGDVGGTDISGVAILIWALVATAIIAAVYFSLTDSVAITAITTVVMIVMAFFFTAVASYIVGLVGNSNSPVSGMTITAVLFTGILLLMLGFTGTQGMVATLGVAAVVCCAACTSGDVCNDLKTGAIVGANPRKQQIMQIVGVAAAALVMAPVLQLLHENTPGGIGGKELPAPQAQLFAALARGFFEEGGSLPWDMVAWGAGLGAVILIIDFALEKSSINFRAHLMPIAVGMYLPFDIATPILLGGLIATMLSKGLNEEDSEKALRPGVLFSSGVIAGESLMGVGLAMVAALEVTKPSLGLDSGLVTGLTMAAALGILIAFYINGRRRA